MAMKKIIGSGGGCFRAGTQVQLENGITIAIEDIKVGDEILAFDERGDLHTAKVIKHHIHTDPQPIMRVKFWDGEIFITPNHWVLNQYNAFAEIQNLVAGHDTVVSGMGHLLPIKSKEIIGRGVVYNLTVEPYHTFIADGIRVHNGGHRDRFPVIAGSGGGGGGKGGGGAPRQAVEASDTLQSKSNISIIDLIGEGKIGGLVNGAKSIFLNNTALLSESGQYNFENTTFDSRDGSPNQSVIAGFSSIETPYSMGDVEITNISPKTFSITNLNVDRVRIVVSIGGLFSQNKTTGDISGSEVSYSFEISVDGASFVDIGSAVVINGKTKSKYQRSTVLTLPNANVGYVIRVRRITADSTTAAVVNKTYLSSYVELTDAKLNYPNSALVTVGIDPTVFSSVPQRAYLVNGLYIQVPNNLGVNASGKTTGVYTGIWNGGFTTAISSNPAWILYDLLTSTRYGLGNYLSSSMIDKSMLYTIGKYCDELVSDGFGGYEPRFSINTQIQTQAEAYKIISDITSTFRGMAYWSGGMVCFRQDSPATPSMVFNQANVVNGEFSYASSSRKDRHSVVNVTWNDPDYNYKQRVEYVEDSDLIKSAMGVKKLDVVAFGCSSRSQAQRVGRWILYTEKYESNVINFTVGLDSSLLFPGEIVRISDAFKAGKRAGGRILSSTSTSVTLDSPVTLSLGSGLTAVASISIFLAMPDGSFAERVIAQTAGSFTVLTWTTALTTLPLDNALFVLSDEVVPMLARVLAVAQDGKHADQFIVSAVEHNPSKYGAIESGLLLTKPKTSITPPYVTVLTNLHLEESTYFIAPGIIGSKVHVSWEGQASVYTISYRITTASSKGNWVNRQINVPIFDVEGLAQNDILDVKVSGLSLLGVWTTPITGTLTIAGKSIPPKAVATFTATSLIRSIQLRWTYPVDMDIDFDRVNIRWSATSDVESAATLLTSIKADNYLVSGLNFASTPYYFWIKTVDTSGNESLQSLHVTASTLDEAGAMVTTLNGMLGSSALNAELGTRLSLAEDSFDQFQTWYYTTTAESWTAVNATLTWVNTGSVTITSTAANPQLISPAGLAIVGGTYPIIKAKVNRLAGTTGWAGSLYYKTTGGWVLAKTITIPAGFNVIGGSALLEFNLKDVSAWMATTAINPVTQLRLDIGSTTASGDSFSIDWLAVGRNAPGASNQALVAAQTNISDLNASYTVKIDVNGYVSGFGLASDTTNGVTTSSFAIRADMFSIANPAGPGASAPIVPFSVLTTPTTIDGSVFPAGVYIDNAYITKITADKIDSRGLSIRDNAGNIILASGNALDWSNIGGTDKAANKATKTLVYSQATVPTTPNEGDVWYVSATLAGYVTGAVYIYKSAAWVRTADATISQLGGSGVNILDPRFATFEEATLPPFSLHGSGTLSQDATARYFGTKSLKIVTTGIGGYWNGATGYTTNIQPNKKWIISGYVYSSTVIAAPVWGTAGIHLGVYTPSAYYGTAGYDGNAAYGTLTIPANTWTRIYGVLNLTADSNTTCLLRIDSHATGTTVWFDGIMLEAQVGDLKTPSVYQEPVNFLTTYLGDLSATRNVYKGNWDTGRDYVTGDIVIDTLGYGWSCVEVHTSSASILTPVYPITANTYWTLYVVKGTDGAEASNYALSLSSSVISKSVLNVLTPTSSTAKIYKTTGTASPVLYAGRFRIATSPDGTTYTDVYTSSADESSKAYIIPVTAKTVRVRAYLAGGVTTLLDEEVITIVTDGSSGIDSVNNIVAVLSNENQSIPADNEGVTGVFSAVSTMSVYNGAVDDSANWTYAKVDSNATSTITGAVATVTALAADSGTVTITATRSASAQVNILSGSETFDAAKDWYDASALGNTGVVVATSTIPAPNGALTAKKITANAGLVLFYRKGNKTFPAGQYSVSTYVYVPTQAGINNWNVGNDFADAEAAGGTVYTVFDKWVRFENTITTTLSRNFLDWNINMNGANLTAGVVFHVWGAMCKTGAASGKYIPYLAPVSKVFSLAKAKAGTPGATGPQGIQGVAWDVPQMTAANISTYIGPAAIQSAQIGSIALTGSYSFGAVTTPGMIMDANNIRVYDSLGYLRVKLGNLA